MAPNKNPVLLFKAHGTPDDAMDNMRLTSGFEDPSRWEQTILEAYKEAEREPALAKILSSVYLQENREEAFASFAKSGIPGAIKRLVNRLGIGIESEIADLGCGPGHLAYAMHKLGFQNVTAMEPNKHWYTGTGYLSSIAGDQIHIINDLEAWQKIKGRFDLIVSQGTIHHWQHIPKVALDARRTLKPGAFWCAIKEFFANTPRELVDSLENHPTATRYNSYEWPYPASAYVDLIQSVGFNLVSVIPYFYNQNELVGSMAPVPGDVDIPALSAAVDKQLMQPGGTVDSFWEEVDIFRRQEHGNHIFVNPQALIFQRIAI
jgi:SAM-dependent methyltransferase